MTMRKPNYAEQMRDLKNEIEKAEMLVESAIREIETLKAQEVNGMLTKKQNKHIEDLVEYIKSKETFIAKSRKQVQAYYAPMPA